MSEKAGWPASALLSGADGGTGRELRQIEDLRERGCVRIFKCAQRHGSEQFAGMDTQNVLVGAGRGGHPGVKALLELGDSGADALRAFGMAGRRIIEAPGGMKNNHARSHIIAGRCVRANLSCCIARGRVLGCRKFFCRGTMAPGEVD